MTTTSAPPLMEVRGITKSFAGVQVLHHVTLDIQAGEVLGILGENGAGKSTLLKILSGIYQKTDGQILIEGEEVDLKSSAAAKALGIAMIPQEFNLISTLNVFENIFLGNEQKKYRLLDKKAMRKKTRELLQDLETEIDPNALIESLSVAQKQMVEIAKALVRDSRILIMDEPTTVLTSHEVKVLFRLVNKLRARGVTVIFISHKLKEVKQLCDRLAILRDGHLISLESVTNLDEADMARKMVGRELNQIYPAKSTPSADVIFSVSDLSVKGMVSSVSFELHAGEVLGFAGLIGAGRTEMAEAIMGLRQRASGTFRIKGQPATLRTPREAVQRGLAYLSEDRQGKGLIMNFDIPQNITLISLRKYIRGLISRKQEIRQAKGYRQRFDIKAATLQTHLINLSGGNQQKVYLAKWMDTEPEILILDEPTRGIDVNTKKEIYHFIQSLTEQGLAVIVISSEMEEIIGLSNRVIVMRSGSVMGTLEGDDINEEEIMYYAAGLKKSVA